MKKIRCPLHQIVYDAVAGFDGRWCDLTDIYCKIKTGTGSPVEPATSSYYRIILDAMWWLEHDGMVERRGPLRSGSVWKSNPGVKWEPKP